jgi:NAD(P)-dependent dehydrogenase (short-subunit alcohol dehydrogenase family)
LRGSFFVAQAIAPGMIKRRYGRIINIGSVTSVAGYAGLGPYGASRGGIRQLTMSLADDWGKYGITVNCLAPGWFRTEQNQVLYENGEWVDYLCDRIPMKRPGHPDDLDSAIVFLAAESSRYVTGQTLLVDGGISTGATRALVQSAQASPNESK